ncbi:MAG: hypothetical protein NC082_07510 [Clostridiales bacterium]|nr:hypothetical protein [Clostridiales bacterium]
MKKPPRSIINGTATALIAIALILIIVILVKACGSAPLGDSLPTTTSPYTIEALPEGTDSLKNIKTQPAKKSRKGKNNSSGKSPVIYPERSPRDEIVPQ